MKKLSLLLLTSILFISAKTQSVGFNSTGAVPDPKAMLDIASTKSGLLIPRMTTSQRDSIVTPPNSLQIYNLTTNTLDVYRSTHWESMNFKSPSSNQLFVYSLSDLPTPSGSAITLDSTKIYIFSGFVYIGSNYINLNGAGIRGLDPVKDGIISTATGGILRSVDKDVLIQQLNVVPYSSATKAYDFSDGTGTKFCFLLLGSAVTENAITSLGVGQISGFKAITLFNTYWRCSDGVKIAGHSERVALLESHLSGITTGAGIEFLTGGVISDLDISNNYFTYTGQIGVKVNTGVTIDRGRMTTNMFRNVGTNISGFDSYTPGWDLRQNSYIPNSRAYAFIFMNSNPTATSLPVVNTYYKIAGTTTMTKDHRFTTANDRLTYTGKDTMTAKVLVVLGAFAPNDNSSFSIAIAKNGVIIPTPNGSMAPSSNNQSFQITLATEVDMASNDYIEVFIRTNNSNSYFIKVDDLQFRAMD